MYSLLSGYQHIGETYSLYFGVEVSGMSLQEGYVGELDPWGERYDERVWTGFSFLRIQFHDVPLSDSEKDVKFLDQHSNC
jgi:hypothetical protein